MQEEDVVRFAEGSLFRQSKKTGKSLPGVYRIEENPLLPGHQFNCSIPFRGGDRITGSAEIAQRKALRTDLNFCAKQRCRFPHQTRRDFIKRIAVDHHSIDLCLRKIQRGTQSQTGHGPSAALGADQVIEADPLQTDFPCAVHIAQGTQCIGTAARNLVVRSPGFLSDPVHLSVDVRIVIRIHQDDLGSHEMFKQLVADPIRHASLFQNQNRLHPQFPCGGSGEHRMVGLRATRREDDFRSLPLGISQQIFQLANLVAAEAEPREIIALHIDAGMQKPADIVEPLDRRRKDTERYFRVNP